MVILFRNCWVINNKTDDCWLIDDDNTKPIYLENGWPKYDKERMMDYRLSNHPSEKYLSQQSDGQLSIFDFMED
ncbi:MAG: hypothetical protein J6Y78_17810 [Paludibacteraceae bacterium]|nr:hypothetical protein [Paludibacteraceae bacterium]